MLTLKEIETKKFSKAKTGGYQPEEVERFLDEIYDSYNLLLSERDNLSNEILSLNGKIDKASAEIKELKEKLSDPQSAYNETINLANSKADKIVYEAQNYAKKLIEAAHVEAERQQKVSSQFVNEVEDFKSKLLSIYENHVKLISSIPVIKVEEVPAESKTLEMLENSTVDASPEEVSAPVSEKEVKETVEKINEQGVEYEEKVAENENILDTDIIEDSVKSSVDEEGAVSAPETPVVSENYVPSRYNNEEQKSETNSVPDRNNSQFVYKKVEKDEREPEDINRYHMREVPRNDSENDPDTAIDGLFDMEESDKKKKKKKFSFYGFVKDSDDDDDDFDDDFGDDDYFDDYDDEE